MSQHVLELYFGRCHNATRFLNLTQASITAGEVVVSNIERYDEMRPSSKEKSMDLMLITQVLQATGYEFGYGEIPLKLNRSS